MRIIFLLNKDIHAAYALNLLFKNLKKHQVKIVLSKKVGKKNSLPKELKMLKKHEQPALPSFDRIAQFFGEKIKSYKDINSKTAVKDFQKFAPDLIISIRFGQILKDEIIAVAKHGVINLHSGILPGYRGVLASFWAILNGEKQIGSTLHYIENSKIDDGQIIKINKQKIAKDKSLIFNISSLYKDGTASIIEAINKIEKKQKIKTINPKTLGKANYFSFPGEKEITQFKKILPLYNDADIKMLQRFWK